MAYETGDIATLSRSKPGEALANVGDVRPRMPLAVMECGMGLRYAGFRSAKARDRYLSVYGEVRARSPRPSIAHDVPTEFGTARVYQHGPDGGIPIVLIHGFFLTSAMWNYQIESLVSEFTVYTVDMLGQPGASAQSSAMFTATRSAQAVDGVLAGLNLRDVHLVGHSYGGWLATQTAARAPGRLRSVTLIDPANTVARISARFWRTVASIVVQPRSPRARRSAGWLIGNPAPGSMLDELGRLFMAGFAEFGAPMNTSFPYFPSDALLRAIKVPVQVLLAGNTVHDSVDAIQRIQSVLPTWDHRLWPDTSHALFGEAPEEINACIERFVTRHHAS